MKELCNYTDVLCISPNLVITKTMVDFHQIHMLKEIKVRTRTKHNHYSSLVYNSVKANCNLKRGNTTTTINSHRKR